MKKILITITCSVCCCITAAQTTLTLDQCKQLARDNNIALRSARNNIEQAEQQRKQAFTNYFPQVSAMGAGLTANKHLVQMDMTFPAEMSAMLPAGASMPTSMGMIKNGVVGNVMAMQPIFAGGQIVNANRLAKVGVEASRIQLEASEDEVELTTEQYFWQIVSLQEKMKTVAAVETMLADIHKDVDAAVSAGIALRNDLLQVQLRQNEVESQRLKLQNGISIVRLLLAQYCGLRDTSFTLSHHADAVIPVPLKQDHQQALFSTSEYQLLGKQVEAANLQRKMEIGKNLPTVAVGVGYNYHTLLENDHSFAMLFATVSVPISDWWGGSHAIKRKKIAYQQAQDQLTDNAQLLTIRMQNAWNSVVEARQQLDIAQRSIEQSEENLRLHRDYYRAGTCKMSDLLEAQLLYQQSCDKHTDAYADLQNKILEYKQSTGQ